MTARILLVEDEPAIQELIAVNLARAGHEVQRATSAEGAQGLLKSNLPDLIVLDWVLPGMSGIDLVRTLRSDHRTRDVSLILVTGRDHERDKLAGLDSGADDYITKPFSVRELLARIAAVLRRRMPLAATESVVVGALRLDPVGRRVIADGGVLELGRTEFRLLHFLMTHADRVHSRTHLLDQVWGENFLGDERTVDVHVRRLRSTLQGVATGSWIHTVRGYGYSFSARTS